MFSTFLILPSLKVGEYYSFSYVFSTRRLYQNATENLPLNIPPRNKSVFNSNMTSLFLNLSRARPAVPDPCNVLHPQSPHLDLALKSTAPCDGKRLQSQVPLECSIPCPFLKHSLIIAADTNQLQPARSDCVRNMAKCRGIGFVHYSCQNISCSLNTF